MIGTVFNQSDFRESLWSGGSTKELYIYPSDSSYANRDFQLRISTARVEIPSSTFTSLPGVDRRLMILDGEITIRHEKHYQKVMKPFDVDAFPGDWTTSALGTCVDFNVMSRGGLETDLFSLKLAVNERFEFPIEQVWNQVMCFVVTGEMNCSFSKESHQVYSDELLVVENVDGSSLMFSAKSECTMAIVLARV